MANVSLLSVFRIQLQEEKCDHWMTALLMAINTIYNVQSPWRGIHRRKNVGNMRVFAIMATEMYIF